MINDVRFALRILWKNRLLTLLIVLTVGLGIGINTFIFSAVNALALRPLPFKQAQRLCMVFENNLKEGIREFSASGPNFLDWRIQNQVFEEIAATTQTRFNLTDIAEPAPVSALLVSPNFFKLLGVQPLRGRAFSSDEDQPGKNRVIVLSYGLWQRCFGGRSEVLGESIQLDGHAYTVIGIMPPDVGFLNGLGESFVPLPTDQLADSRGKHWLLVLARLKDTVSRSQAEAGMGTIARRLAAQYPESNQGWGVELVAIQDQLYSMFRPALFILQGAVVFVLLIVCSNIASFLLARAGTRNKEMAIRLALGANRRRLITQLMTENTCLALAGGLLGVLLAAWGVNTINAWSLLEIGWFRPWNPVRVDVPVLLFTAALSIIAGILFGLVPALQTSKPDLTAALKDAAGLSFARTSRHWLLKGLIIAETACALVLLIGAGLMVKNVIQLQQVDAGFATDHTLSMTLNLPESAYPDDTRQIAFFEEMLTRVQTVPGITSQAITDIVPLGGDSSMFAFGIEGRPLNQDAGKTENVQYRRVSADYFKTLRIPLLRGRPFAEKDRKDTPRVVIINEATAQRYWPNQNPLGQKIHIADGPACEIVGVVKNERFRALNQEAETLVYVPYQQGIWWLGKLHPFSLLVRTQNKPESYVQSIRSIVREIDKNMPLSNIRTLDQLLSQSISLSRISTQLLGVFALAALALSIMGVYGLLSYSVSQGTREIGVRIALGAQPGEMIHLTVKQGMRWVICGLTFGLGGALALTRLLTSLLFNVQAADPLTYLMAAVLLGSVACLACYCAARRAARVNPIVALRYE